MNVHEAFLAAQRSMPRVVRDATNPHFRSAYVSLDALLSVVLPVLHERGLLLRQALTVIDGQQALSTSIVLAESGEEISSVSLLPLPLNATAQQFGSGLTYVRRYALAALVGIVTDSDDDGDAASRRPSDHQAATVRVPQIAAQSRETQDDVIDPVSHVGKYKGQRLSSIPVSYLKWIASNFDPLTDADRALKAAAIAMIPDEEDRDDIPF